MKENEFKIASIAESMLDSLLENSLEVVLIPDQQYNGQGSDFRKLRAAQSYNPDWYRKFCSLYKSNRVYRGRKFKTKIKKRETIKALNNLINFNCKTIYDLRLKEFILEKMENEK